MTFPYRTVVLADSPDLFWLYPPTLINVTDLGGGGHTGILSNNSGLMTANVPLSRFIQAFRYPNGSVNDNVAAARTAVLDWPGAVPGTTIEWVMRQLDPGAGNDFGCVMAYDRDANGDGTSVFMKQDGGGQGVTIRWNHGGVATDFTVPSFFDDATRHYVVRYDQSTGDAECFVQGALEDTAAIGVVTPVNDVASFFTGVSQTLANPMRGGAIGAIAYFKDVALTEAQISAHFCALSGDGFVLKCSMMKGGDELKGSAILPPEVIGVPVTSTVEFVTTATGAAEALGQLLPSTIEFSTFAAPEPETDPEYKVVVTDASGAMFGEINKKCVLSAELVLNTVGSSSLKWSKSDENAPQAALTKELAKVAEREIQIFRGKQLLWWGPIVVPAISNGFDVQAQAQEAHWHLGRRNMGPLEPENLVTNGAFEQGLLGWTIAREQPNFTVTPTCRTDSMTVVTPAVGLPHPESILGTFVLRISIPQADFDAGTPCFIVQPTLVTVTEDDPIVAASAWFYVPSATWQGEGRFGRGFSLTYADPADMPVPFGPNPLSAYFTAGRDLVAGAIVESTPKDSWQRVELSLELPPGTFFVIPRLEGTGGIVYYDDVRVVHETFLNFDQVEQGDIIEALVDHAQDPAFDKSDVNIDTEQVSSSDQFRDRKYSLHERQNIWRAIQEFVTIHRGVNLRMQYFPNFTPATGARRLIVEGFTEELRRNPDGSIRKLFDSNPPLKRYPITQGLNIVSYSYSRDGQQGSSSVTVFGSKGGQVKEHGSVTDLTLFGGVTLQRDVNTSADLLPKELGGGPIDASGFVRPDSGGVAEAQFDVVRNPNVITVEVTNNPIVFAGQVRPDHILPVRIDDEFSEVDAFYRIIRMAFLPATDNVRFTLNFVAERIES